MNPLKELVKAQKSGKPVGMYSICSANEFVIKAAMERELKESGHLLVEATANQVNQYGGYTGMKPDNFRDFVYSLCESTGFPKDRVILGGDHLGPLVWRRMRSDKSMEEAAETIRQYVMAGFAKIHIDTSMLLGEDDTRVKLDTEIIAGRCAILADTAEKTFARLRMSNPNALHPVYVIGSEVPVPGGSVAEEGIQITKASDFEETIDAFKKAFYRHRLADAWDNVIAVVVQPGMEFGSDSVHAYNRAEARELCTSLKKYAYLVFEGHSTDYQTAKSLKELVEDGIAILKVGPALTFALREALFALNLMEKELFKGSPDIVQSGFMEVLEAEMLKNPENWERHYRGNSREVRLLRRYSYSDRSRYYLSAGEVGNVIARMLDNLKSLPIPITLISQYMPLQYAKIRANRLEPKPESLVKDAVIHCIEDYIYAVRPT